MYFYMNYKRNVNYHDLCPLPENIMVNLYIHVSTSNTDSILRTGSVKKLFCFKSEVYNLYVVIIQTFVTFYEVTIQCSIMFRNIFFV